MKSWLDRWNAYWFPRTTTLHLAVCRIIAVGAQLFWFFPSFDKQVHLLETNSEFVDPQLLIRAIAAIAPRDTLFTPSAFAGFFGVIVVAGLAALVGFFTRTSLFVFALGIWILIAHLYSYSDVHHESAVFSIFLMLLAFAPSGDRLSVDALLRRPRARLPHGTAEAAGTTDMAMWPLKVGHVLLAITYFSAGISKMIAGGFRWMNGYTLQDYVFADAMQRGFPFGVWLGQHHTLAVFFSVFTVLFELTFFLSLVLPRTAPFYFLNGLLFQIGLYAAAGHDFFPHMVLLFLLLLFVEPGWWQRRLRPPAAEPVSTPKVAATE